MSAIEWTDETWNPTVGCSKVSPGCGLPMPGHDGETHGDCYAIGVAHRAMQPAHEGLTIRRPGERPDWTGEVRCLPDRLDVPLRWRKPRRVFVDSMSDLFHPDVPEQFARAVWEVMAKTPQHTYQILTKRPQRMADQCGAGWVKPFCPCDTGAPQDCKPEEWGGAHRPPLQWTSYLPEDRHRPTPLPNVWLGTSIESDRYTWRADHLRATPAAVRFLSLEPLLGPLPSLDLTGIDWVIVGGESGPGARPMDLGWVREIAAMCDEHQVPLFVKQLGAVVARDWEMGDRKGHDIDEFPEDLRRREMPR